VLAYPEILSMVNDIGLSSPPWCVAHKGAPWVTGDAGGVLEGGRKLGCLGRSLFSFKFGKKKYVLY